MTEVALVLRGREAGWPPGRPWVWSIRSWGVWRQERGASGEAPV